MASWPLFTGLGIWVMVWFSAALVGVGTTDVAIVAANAAVSVAHTVAGFVCRVISSSCSEYAMSAQGRTTACRSDIGLIRTAGQQRNNLSGHEYRSARFAMSGRMVCEERTQPFGQPACVLKMEHVRGTVEHERLRMTHPGGQQIL